MTKVRMHILIILMISIIILIVPKTNNSYGQVFLDPKVKAQTIANQARIERIEITEENSMFTISINTRSSAPIYISSKTYIIPSEGGDPMYIQKVDGLELDKMYIDRGHRTLRYKLYFPAIDPKIETINLRAGEGGNYWHFFEIQLPLDTTAIDENIVKSGKKGKTGKCWYIDSPSYTATSGGLDIIKIELCDTATILHFKVKIPNKSYIYIPPKSSIRDSNGGENLFVRSAEGTNIDKKIYSEGLNDNTIIYKLFFPPIDKSVKKIDFREMNRNGSWFVYELDTDVDEIE